MRRRFEPAPPCAALQLQRDQVRAGYEAEAETGDGFDVAAEWEKRAMQGPIEQMNAFTRIGRAFCTGKSPRTRRGRWRRDLEYLEAVKREARATLPEPYHHTYATMVADWRKQEPRGIFGRYTALRNRQRQAPAAGPFLFAGR